MKRRKPSKNIAQLRQQAHISSTKQGSVNIQQNYNNFFIIIAIITCSRYDITMQKTNLGPQCQACLKAP